PRHDLVVTPAVDHREMRGLERRRYEDRPVEADAFLLQQPRQASDAVSSIALSCDEDRRAPPPMFGQPSADELAHRLEVGPDAEIGVGIVPLGCLLRGITSLGRIDDTAEAGADRIDEDDIRE